MITDRVYTLVGGSTGAWQVVRMDTIAGTPLEPVAHVEVINGDVAAPLGAGVWRLCGVTSNERYTTRAEHERLVAAQPVLGRIEGVYFPCTARSSDCLQ